MFLLTAEKTRLVSIYGTKNGELIMPTLWAALGEIQSGTTLGADAQVPQTGADDQILAVAQHAEEIVQGVREDAANGLFGGSQNKGDRGDPAQPISQSVEHQTSDSGTVLPTGIWENAVPAVPVVSYCVSCMGIHGAGSVSSINAVSPDEQRNVNLPAFAR